MRNAETVSYSQAATLLGVSESEAYRLVERRKLKSVIVKFRPRHPIRGITQDSLDAYLAERARDLIAASPSDD